jgi:hypothetical protein
MRFVRRSFAVPDCAATHPHWYVKLWVEWAILVFANRARLDKPIRDLNGHMLVRAMPEWHLRPYVRENADALDRRRADFMQNVLATQLIGIAHMSFKSKVVLPDPRAPDYMLLREWGGELPGEPSCADPIDAVERPIRFLKAIGFFSFTKQHRRKVESGRILSTGAAIRRISLRWLKAMHGMIASGTTRLETWLEEQEEKEAKKQREADEAFTDELSKAKEPLIVPPRAPAPPAAERPRPENDPDLAIFDQIEREHPEWIDDPQAIGKVNAEVRRLKAEAAAAARNTS